MQHRFWHTYGIARSLFIYYRPRRIQQLRRFYGQFIRPGDLCFDIGAHAGNRVKAWVGLKAKVVAVEPQPAFMRLLETWYGARPDVTLIEQAVGAKPGQARMLISRRTPTLTTLDRAWAERVARAPGFATARWDEEVGVDVSTLDALIARFGLPAFCKIDIEGYELEALKGLSQPIPQLSFEIIPVTADIACACIERLESLGRYEYNFSRGESLRLWPHGWLRAAELSAWLNALPADAPSGDIYARLFEYD